MEIPESATHCPSCGADAELGSTPTLTFAGEKAARPATPSNAPKTKKSGTPSSHPSASGTGRGGHYVAGETLAERYRIVAMLGKGGMGEVYRAEDLRLSQSVALKFLPLSMMEDEGARERFHQEVRLAREISHPNICRVFDIGEVGGRLFLTMEYVDGEDLASLLRRIGQFPQTKALDIARQMCAGIAAAHGHGVLHRDLKPANIMLDGRGRVRITDFGLASLAENLNAAEFSSGTPAYMAPEQLAGTEVTPRSDIYSLGLVLYEIFTGKKAFEAATLPEILRLRERSAPSSLSQIVQDIDPLVERVILRCLEKDPAKRPATALQVAAALPGGDPLAAALAAGETPSPEMVAAAGEKEGLRPAVAWVCLLLTFIGLSVVAYMSDRLTTFTLAPMPISADVLAAKAREMSQNLNCGAKPTDTFYGVGHFTGYLEYVVQHDTSKTRWNQLNTGAPPLLAFWYRTSPQYLETSKFSFSQTVDPDEPPSTVSGMCTMFLDMRGHLIGLKAVPPQVDAGTPPSRPSDWGALFSAAGLDMASFHGATPKWNPATASDASAAWEGTWPGRPDIPLRVEAAAYRGNPVYFDLISPWSKPDPTQPEKTGIGDIVQTTISLVAMCVLLFVGARLSARNLATGRADRKGAFRLAAFAFLLTCAAGILFEHHVPTTHEVMILFIASGWGMIAGGLVWLLYLALEAHVRRRWPSALISWSRLLAGRVRDPLVGRDLLIGLMTGVLWVIIARCARLVLVTWLNKAPLAPIQDQDFIQLSGLRFIIGDIFLNIIIFVFGALAFFMIFFLFRAMLRREQLAAWVLVLIAAAPSLLSENPGLNFAGNALLVGLGIFVLTRFGLLALVIMFTLNNVLQAYPLTTHISEWYAQPTIFVFVALLAVAVFGFYVATKGHPIFGSMRIEE
jgi:serine/threonine-protein kinase